MRRAIPSLLRRKESNINAESQLQRASQGTPDYAEKLKLATALHDQGINPARWQEAAPAPHEAQKQYRETRQVPEEMFVVRDRLYRRSSEIAANWLRKRSTVPATPIPSSPTTTIPTSTRRWRSSMRKARKESSSKIQSQQLRRRTKA